MEIDLPEVVAEVKAAFEGYEKALVANHVGALNALFYDYPRTIRYGGAENLYGYAEISAFRAYLIEDRHQHLRARFRRRFDVVSPCRHTRKSRTPDADVGALSARLARRRGACQRDRRQISGRGLKPAANV
jgi:hypothetical protein